MRDSGGLIFTPVLDNHVLIDTYNASVEKGITLDIDYMLGSTESDLGVTPEMVEWRKKPPV